MPARHRDLGANLDRLAAQDPAVTEAAERLDWLARKAAMGWPSPRRIPKSAPPNQEAPVPEIRIYAAQPTISTQPVAPLTIHIDQPIPDVSVDAAAKQFADQGKTLANALWNVLPGGTVDQLLAALMQRKASLYRVRMPEGDPS